MMTFYRDHHKLMGGELYLFLSDPAPPGYGEVPVKNLT